MKSALVLSGNNSAITGHLSLVGCAERNICLAPWILLPPWLEIIHNQAPFIVPDLTFGDRDGLSLDTLQLKLRQTVPQKHLSHCPSNVWTSTLPFWAQGFGQDMGVPVVSTWTRLTDVGLAVLEADGTALNWSKEVKCHKISHALQHATDIDGNPSSICKPPSSKRWR